MTRTVRSMLTALALGFAVYFVARAVWWVEQPSAPLLMVAGIAVYLTAILVAALAGSAARVQMPMWAAILALIAGVAVPSLVSLALDPMMRSAGFATWYIGAVGVLAVVCIVRRRAVFGWVITGVLVISASAYLGLGDAFTLGLVGSITWVVLAQLLVFFWGRAVRDTERFADIQRAVSSWRTTQLARQRERRLRVQVALAVAGPVLSRTVSTGGHLSESERLNARLAEGRMRDELRGASLLNDAVRAAIHEARTRGVIVTVFDEGGFEGIGEQRRGEIRDELASVLAAIRSDRVIIRAGRDEHLAVTVVGRAAAGASRDEDAVDLWHEIPRVAGQQVQGNS